MKPLEDFTQDDLWQLRSEIVLNSLFVHDYENSFGIDEHSACDFFDGYCSFLWDIAEQEGHGDWDDYDSPEHLYQWFLCFDDFSWVIYSQTAFAN